jgi:hypothetical protein
MLTADNGITVAARLLLLSVDWLTFHDFFEPRTPRDCLALAASAMVFLHSARPTGQGSRRTGQTGALPVPCTASDPSAAQQLAEADSVGARIGRGAWPAGEGYRVVNLPSPPSRPRAE